MFIKEITLDQFDWPVGCMWTLNHAVRSEIVEFQQSNDRRTGKPIATAVIRAKTSCEIMSEKPASGVVLAEARAVKNKGVSIEL